RMLDAAPREVVPGWCPRVRLFIGTHRGKPLGLLVNPLERSNNMITVRTLEKYGAGLDLFRALRLPIVSVLDSPGIDPRCEQDDGFSDLLAQGALDAVVQAEDLPAELDRFLDCHTGPRLVGGEPRPRRRSAPHMVLAR